MNKVIFYSVASFVISASLWVAEFFVSVVVPGRQFRFLTIWGLTAAMCMHAYQLVRMRRSPSSKVSALFTTAAAINLVILLMYWTAYFVFPHMIAVEGYHVLHDIFIHAICPLLCIMDTAFLSNLSMDFKLSTTYLLASIVAYVLWLELFVAPFSVLPYAFLRGVTMSARIVCYLGIGLFSHFSHALLYVCKNASSKQNTRVNQSNDRSISAGLKSEGDPAIEAGLQSRSTASPLPASKITACHEATSTPEGNGDASNALPITATVPSAGASEEVLYERVPSLMTGQNGVKGQPRYSGRPHPASSPSPSDASEASTVLFDSRSLLEPLPEGHGVFSSSPPDASMAKFSPSPLSVLVGIDH